MSIVFTPKQFGDLKIKNRFIHSACEDNMATEKGEVTDGIIQKNRKLAKGGVGLIIWSHLFVHPLGRTKKYQSGIHSDDMVDGLSQVAKAVHEEGGKIAFQLGHAGIQTDEKVISQKPSGPKSITEDQIQESIGAFKEGAMRAVESGVDAIQLHGAHGYLISGFLSPYYNTRADQWGGWRNFNDMEDAVSKGETNFISMCRPFIREPNLIKRFEEGKTKMASCKNCNKCLAALPNDIPVRCYYKGFPSA